MKPFQVSRPRISTGRRRRQGAPRRLGALIVETLETRQLLTIGPVMTSTLTAIPAPYYVPTDTNLLDTQHGPMANLGTESVSIYRAFATDFAASVAAGQVTPAAATALAAKIASQFPTVEFDNGSVAMDINSLGGDFNAFVGQLQGLGVDVTAASSAYGIVEGYVPIDELPTIARLPQTEAGSPIRAAISHAFQGFQGVAYNEPETSLGADAARSQYGLDGTGVTIGVLSDSVNSVGGGLQDSYNTGDLNPNQPVYVVPGQAGSGGEDEGRAMLESIHDIAPGASLQFATAGPGDLGFMQNIEALYNAGSKVIVDDISYPDEPYFQDGLIAQGIDYVTSRGDSYFTSAANSGSDQGYLSAFRPVTATVNGTTGTWQNFNGGSGAASELLPVTTGINNATINFQYDQPFKTQEPAGATATTTSDLSFYVYNSSGTIVASGTDNNVATQQPYQLVSVPSPGSYFIAIKLVSGQAPGHVEFVDIDNSGALNVSQTYGAAGGTYYPSSEGHETAAAAIGVAATPWFAPSPFESLGSATPTEASSSTGPGLIDLTPKGTPATAQIIQDPAITGADGGSTSFFGSPVSDSTGLAPPSTYNFYPTNQQNLKSFFGTSQAAPNVAAVVVLMLQEKPTLSRVQILKALETTASPINNTPAGTWNVQSGYGFVNAVAAIQSIAPASSLAASTTTGTPSTTTPTVNQSFTLTANVSGTGATPTGSVDFYDISYNTDYGSIALAGGAALASITPSQLGAHVYLLTYSGNASYAKSTAYVVLDVVSNSPGVVRHNLVKPAGPAAFNTPASSIQGSTTTSALIPLTPEFPATSAPSAGDVTVGNTATTATDADPLVKKHATA